MAGDSQNLYDFLFEEPRFLWLPSVDGNLGELFGKVGNFIPYLNLKIGGLPLFTIPNEHILSFTCTISGTPAASLSMIDPTNFVIERMLRYAFTQPGNDPFPIILIQWGWTDGNTKYGMDNFLEFDVQKFVQTIDVSQTRWTIDLIARGDYVARNLKIPQGLQLPSGLEENDLQTFIGQNVPGGKISVILMGKIDQKINVDLSGMFNQPGNLTLKDLISQLVSQLKSNEGNPFAYRWISEVNENAVIRTDDTDDKTPPNTTLDWPPGTAGILLIFDRVLASEQHASASKQRNASLPSNRSAFAVCDTLLIWPNNLGYISQVSVAGDTDWIGVGKRITETSIGPDGKILQKSTEIPIEKTPVVQVNISDLGDASVSAEQIAAAGAPTTGAVSPAIEAAVAMAQRVSEYANNIKVTGPGEPWFVNQANFVGMMFGFVYDQNANLARVMRTFDPTNSGSLQKAIPLFYGVDDATMENITASGIFDPNAIDSQLNGIYELRGVTHTIQAGSYKIEYDLLINQTGTVTGESMNIRPEDIAESRTDENRSPTITEYLENQSLPNEEAGF